MHIRTFLGHKKKYVVLGLIALNTAAALFIGYYYFTEIAPYREWNVFEDPSAGYSIKYPMNWYLHDEAYISPLSESALRREYPASIEVWGLGVGSSDTEAFMRTIDQELRLVRSKNKDSQIFVTRLLEGPDGTVIQAVVRDFSSKILPPVYEATFAKGGGEWVIYWVSDGERTWRIDRVCPFEKWDEFGPVFEKIIASLETGPDRFAWGPVILGASQNEEGAPPPSVRYFLSEPAPGFSIPSRTSFPVGFSLESTVFTEDRAEHMYVHRRFGSRIQVIEDRLASFSETVAEYEASEGAASQYERVPVTIGTSEGIAIAWYAGAETRAVTSVTVLLDKDGHLFSVIRDALPDETLTIPQVTAELETFTVEGQ